MRALATVARGVQRSGAYAVRPLLQPRLRAIVPAVTAPRMTVAPTGSRPFVSALAAWFRKRMAPREQPRDAAALLKHLKQMIACVCAAEVAVGAGRGRALVPACRLLVRASVLAPVRAQPLLR